MTVLGLLSALLLKPAALVVVALGVTALMRRTGSDARHAVWVAAIVAVLALPVLAALLPDLRVSSLDDGLRRVSVAVQPPPVTPEARNARPSDLSSPPGDQALTPTAIGAERQLSLASATFLIWMFVAMVLLSRRVAAEVHAHRMARRARHASHRMIRLGARIARDSGLTSVDLRVSGFVSSPAVVGLFSPIVLLPESAESWTDADLEPMLAHELTHVARRDCLTNLCGDVAACFYWCNPLVRLSAKRLRLEAERACDERVIGAGADPRSYAELLLRVAHADRSVPSLTHAATAMSRARELESRLVALLDGCAPPARVSKGVATVLVAVGVSITVSAAALTVSAAEVSVPDAAVRVQNAMLPEPDRLGDSLASPASERLPNGMEQRELDKRAGDALAGVDAVFARRLLDATRQAPTHSADLVSDRARWALGRTTNGRLVEPLLESLSDGDWRVQAYAAWALAIAGDARAVPQLIPLVGHPVWRVRAMAAHAIRESRDARGFDAMRAALIDPAWQVRVEAVEYMAARGGNDARSLIRARLEDRHVAVQHAARGALGIH